jgi:hypothetical protein
MARICPVMQDGGRCFTTFLPNCDVENIVRQRLGVTDGFAYRQALLNCPDKAINELRRVNICTRFDKCDGSECQCSMCQQCRSAMSPDAPTINFMAPLQ